VEANHIGIAPMMDFHDLMLDILERMRKTTTNRGLCYKLSKINLVIELKMCRK